MPDPIGHLLHKECFTGVGKMFLNALGGRYVFDKSQRSFY